MLRLVFLGSDAIALPLLQWLASEGGAHARVVGVFTQPDRATGRGQHVQPNAIKLWAQALNLPVLQPEKITAAACAELATLAPDVALVMAYGHILSDDFIATPRLGTLNLHTSLLPKYRGASPIQTAIANGERETGVTLMRVIRQLDAGPLAAAEHVVIGPRDTALDVEQRLSVACVPLLARGLPALAAGTLAFAEQAHATATFCRKLRKEDGALDFTASAAALAARINGLFPWPTCSVKIAGQTVKFGLAQAAPPRFAPLGSGSVFRCDAESLPVATGNGILRILRLQRPGGKMLPAPEFLRGFPVAPGTVLASSPMPALVAGTPFPASKK